MAKKANQRPDHKYPSPLQYGQTYGMNVKFEIKDRRPNISVFQQMIDHEGCPRVVQFESTHIQYALHCREIAKWFLDAAKVMDQIEEDEREDDKLFKKLQRSHVRLIQSLHASKMQQAAKKFPKKVFREFLNAQEAAEVPHGRLKHGQRTRGYGDYLYHQNRKKFDADYAEWLAIQADKVKL